MPNSLARNILWVLLVLLTACSSYSFAWHHPMRGAFQTSISTSITRTRTSQPLRNTLRTTMSSSKQSPPKRVAVLGAGAAGLVTGRLLRDAGFDVRILEKTSTVGGVWKYRPNDVMYKSLTTNLPKEIMAFHDTPFDPTLHSFLGHAQVQEYLEKYTKQYALGKLIKFHTEVKAVRPMRRTSNSSAGNGGGGGDGKERGEIEPWPAGDYTQSEEEEGEEKSLWQVTTSQTSSSSNNDSNNYHHQQQQIYDAIVVCNGHFDVPYSPSLPGLTHHYKGQVLHSRDYDDPEGFRGLKVLCIGYKSSGTDIAREVASVAKEVHVVDRRLSKQKKKEDGGKEGAKEGEGMGLQLGNIIRRPDLSGFLEGGDGKSVGFVDGSVCEGVDVVLFCTGYCYSMPFLSGGTPEKETSPSSSLHPSASDDSARLLRIEDRAVFPIYQHIFHAYFPSLIFLGLLHSVVPFPMFELQAKWVVQSLLSSASAGASCSLPSSSSLPSRRARFQWLEDEKQIRQQQAAGAVAATALPVAAPAPAPAPAAVGLGRDWFYMGPNQWSYNRLLATHAKCLTPELKEDLNVREGIYDDVSKRRPLFPGGGDGYRRCEYKVLPGGEGWTVEEGEGEGQAQGRRPQYL